MSLKKEYKKVVQERNLSMQELSIELGVNLNNLQIVSKNIPKEYRYEDGAHYLLNGYNLLAEQVIDFIKKELN